MAAEYESTKTAVKAEALAQMTTSDANATAKSQKPARRRQTCGAGCQQSDTRPGAIQAKPTH